MQELLELRAVDWWLVPDLLVVGPHFLLVLGDIFGIEQFIGWVMLEQREGRRVMSNLGDVLSMPGILRGLQVMRPSLWLAFCFTSMGSIQGRAVKSIGSYWHYTYRC